MKRSVEPLLDYLKATRGFDFTAYKRSSLMRRVQKRLQAVNVGSYERISDVPGRPSRGIRSAVQHDPDQTSRAFFGIRRRGRSCRATSCRGSSRAAGPTRRFARGPPVVRPARKPTPSRSSSPSSSAIEDSAERVKIYASDVDDRRAHAGARHAIYTAAAGAGRCPPSSCRNTSTGSTTATCSTKTSVGRSSSDASDLVQDAPISRVNLLVCRNTLMILHARDASQGG
jgi:two-component system CheB/CheR fusion protein